jgi:hypothetical protein
MSLHLPGTCLHPADENRRVAERIAALEKVSKDASSLWADSRCRSAVVSCRIVLSTLGRLWMVVIDL